MRHEKNRALQNTYWTCLKVQLRVLDIFPIFTCINPQFTENQSIKLFPLYFGVFSCRCETYPIDFISLSKTLRCESYPI